MWILVHSEGQERETLRQVEHTFPRHHGASSRLGLSEDARSNIWSSVSRGKRRIGAKRPLQPSRSLRSLSRRSLIWRNKRSTLRSSRSRFSLKVFDVVQDGSLQTSSDENPDCRSSVAFDGRSVRVYGAKFAFGAVILEDCWLVKRRNSQQRRVHTISASRKENCEETLRVRGKSKSETKP